MTIRPISQQILRLQTGGSSPDPAIYCPANGFIIDPGAPYVPPIDIGSPSAEEIRLLCTNNAPGYISLTVTTSGSQYYAEIYDATETLIATTINVNSAAALSFTFPAYIVNSLYSMRIKPVSGSITIFKINGSVVLDFQLLQARFNTPNIVTAQFAFQYIRTIKSVIFDCTLNFLSDLKGFLQYSGINRFDFPVDLPALTDASNMFYYSDIVKMIWSAASTANLLSNIGGMLQYTRSLLLATFPTSLPELTAFDNILRYSNINSLSIFQTAPKVVSFSYAFHDCYNLISDEIILPEMPLASVASSVFYNAQKIKKVKFQGLMNNLTTSATLFYDTIRNMSALEEFEFPRQISSWCNATFAATSPRISKLRFPDVITATALTAFQSIGIANSGNNLKEVSGDFDNSASVQFDCYWSYSGITTWNTPKMRCSRFRIGASSTNCAPVTAVEIDWANSNWSYGAACLYLYCNLDATELDRIFTALPTVTGKTMYIKGNPGVAGCTLSIATAKGWTVNTTT